jgi:cell division protein FtsZ
LKPLEQRVPEMRPVEARPMHAERLEMKVEPAPAVLPQAQSIEAQAVRNTPFMPPKPIEAAGKPVIAEPVVIAPQVEALRPAKPASRGPSLFERVTKASRLLHREEPAITRVAPVVNTGPAPAPVPTPVPVAPTPTPAPVMASQPKLAPLDPAERPGNKEEDLLDIPAFLRRQAN